MMPPPIGNRVKAGDGTETKKRLVFQLSTNPNLWAPTPKLIKFAILKDYLHLPISTLKGHWCNPRIQFVIRQIFNWGSSLVGDRSAVWINGQHICNYIQWWRCMLVSYLFTYLFNCAKFSVFITISAFSVFEVRRKYH